MNGEPPRTTVGRDGEDQAGYVVGRVTSLRRYPVKSMLGEDLGAAPVSGRGLLGDRGHALIDLATGRVASAKHPRLWRALLTMAAECLVPDGPAAEGPAGACTGAGSPAVRIRLPDGTTVLSTDSDVDERLSRALGRPVRLASTPPGEALIDRAVPDEVLLRGMDADVAVEVRRLGGSSPPGTFFDSAPLHLLTTATLARIGGLSPRGRMEAVRYRPNVVIETTPPAAGFVENAWEARLLRIGPELTLRVLRPTVRCSMPTLAHGDLPPDPAALQVVAAHNRVEIAGRGVVPCAGVTATVLSPGRIRRGDAVWLLQER